MPFRICVDARKPINSSRPGGRRNTLSSRSRDSLHARVTKLLAATFAEPVSAGFRGSQAPPRRLQPARDEAVELQLVRNANREHLRPTAGAAPRFALRMFRVFLKASKKVPGSLVMFNTRHHRPGAALNL